MIHARRNIIRYILAVVEVMMSVSSLSDTLDLYEYTNVKTPTPGTWNTNYQLSREYAEEHNMPIVMFYGDIGCIHTTQGIKMLNEMTCRDWFANHSKFIMIYKPTTSKVLKELIEAKDAESSCDPDLYLGRQWVKGPEQISAYPIVRISWSKADGTTSAVSFTATNGHMPVTEPYGSSTVKLAGQFVCSLTKYLSGYQDIKEEEIVVTNRVTVQLSPCDYTEFYDKLSYKDDIQPGVWSGRSDLCLKKARETGWLMLWFIAARGSKYDCSEFLRSNLCNQPFCDVVNNYKYLILCCEDYDSTSGRKLKDLIYGYPEPEKILDENTGKMVENHRGYPVRTLLGWDQSGEEIYDWCDYPPSLHLLKIDDKTNVIFHVCKKEGMYETEFSPYAEKFPIPSNMNLSMNAFAPWFQQYLDLYPVSEQISEYVNGGYTEVEVEEVTTTVITNTTYEKKEIAVTETINPTVYQMALHRDNILFRTVTTLGDATVKDRIGDKLRDFDGRISVRNRTGKWYLTYDDTLSSVTTEIDDITDMDIYADTNCTIQIQQRIGNGFTFEGFNPVATTYVTNQLVARATGTMVSVTTTNVVIDASGVPFMQFGVGRDTLMETNLVSGKIYRITTGGNATFEVFSTK